MISMAFTIHLQTRIDQDPDNFAPCKRGTALVVDINVWIVNSLDCYETIHLI